jgi:transposase-like protein
MKRGRQTKLNKELADSIIADRSRLVPYSQVSEAHGIHRNTLREWIIKGLDELEKGAKPTLFGYLASAIRKNECKAIKDLLEEIRTGEKGWQSRCWILERCFSAEFALGAQELTQLRQELEDIKKALKDG